MTLTIEELKYGAEVGDLGIDAVRAVCAEALANREAQPVAWRHDNGPFAGMAITQAKSVADSWIAKGWKVTPLYAVPPAPGEKMALVGGRRPGKATMHRMLEEGKK
ncbi:TPA: hypothetical protein SMF87_004557 [Serratia marcescens]|nr:hypothetical protein [Serratia marcescens]